MNVLTENFKLFNGDCLEVMNDISDESIDMILCDLPYGKTRNKWDKIIPFDLMWKQYKRIIKNRGSIVLFGNEPFSSQLILSNLEMFKYRITWKKTISSGQLNCNYAPLKICEDIIIFSKSGACYVKNKEKAMKYFPQFKKGTPYKIDRKILKSTNYDYQKPNSCINEGFRYPTDIIEFSNPRIKNGHPTQKPIDLLEYLIKTYTIEGDLILDNCMGSGSTGVACMNLNRKFIGIELDENYFDISIDRIFENYNK